MIQSWMHLHNCLQDVRGFTSLLEVPDGYLLHFNHRIIQLREQQTKRPCISRWASTNELAKMVCGVYADVLITALG